MKLTILALGFLSAVSAYTANITSEVGADHIFTPKGFDDNDNVEIFVSGTFPNTCYTRHKVDTVIREQTIEINISAMVDDSADNPCEEIPVPYLENVFLGKLQTGTYSIVVNKTLKDKIFIAPSTTAAIDSHLYAQVDYVELGFTGGANGEALLVGRKSACLELDRIEYLSNNKDTLAVLPIMKRAPKQCTNSRDFFSAPIHFETQSFSHDKILIFVRVLGGKSVSTLVEKR